MFLEKVFKNPLFFEKYEKIHFLTQFYNFDTKRLQYFIQIVQRTTTLGIERLGKKKCFPKNIRLLKYWKIHFPNAFWKHDSSDFSTFFLLQFYYFRAKRLMRWLKLFKSLDWLTNIWNWKFFKKYSQKYFGFLKNMIKYICCVGNFILLRQNALTDFFQRIHSTTPLDIKRFKKYFFCTKILDFKKFFLQDQFKISAQNALRDFFIKISRWGNFSKKKTFFEEEKLSKTVKVKFFGNLPVFKRDEKSIAT